MVKNNLDSFFDNYLEREPLFIDKKVLQANYTPETIPHRNDIIQTIAGILAPALRNEKPSNLFLYGKTGTGKTLSVKHVINNLNEISERKKIPLRIFYLNCKLRR